LISGIFYIQNNLYPSYFTNTTFKNISDPSSFTDGGVLYMNSLSYTNFTIDRCIFALCRGYYGGVIYLDFLSPWIRIKRCRFEGNVGEYGNDIYVSSASCFLPNTISATCSTTLPLSIYCLSYYVSRIINPCYKNIVFFYF
jgi:hypothetical protein